MEAHTDFKTFFTLFYIHVSFLFSLLGQVQANCSNDNSYIEKKEKNKKQHHCCSPCLVHSFSWLPDSSQRTIWRNSVGIIFTIYSTLVPNYADCSQKATTRITFYFPNCNEGTHLEWLVDEVYSPTPCWALVSLQNAVTLMAHYVPAPGFLSWKGTLGFY